MNHIQKRICIFVGIALRFLGEPSCSASSLANNAGGVIVAERLLGKAEAYHSGLRESGFTTARQSSASRRMHREVLVRLKDHLSA